MEPPRPIVKKPRLLKYGGAEPGTRFGKGFSLGELEEAGIDAVQAKALGIPVDRRRKSVWKHNVEALREFLTRIGMGKG